MEMDDRHDEHQRSSVSQNPPGHSNLLLRPRGCEGGQASLTWEEMLSALETPKDGLPHVSLGSSCEYCSRLLDIQVQYRICNIEYWMKR